MGKAERWRRAAHTRFFGVLRGEGRTMAESDAHSVLQGAAWGRRNDGGERRTRGSSGCCVGQNDTGERCTRGSSGCCVGKAERWRRATHTRFFGVLRGEGGTMAESDAHSVLQGAASGRTMEESEAHAVLRGAAWGRQKDGGERRTRGSSGCCVGKAERWRRATHTRFFRVLRGEGRTTAESGAHSVLQGAASGRTMEESDAHAVLRGSAWGRQNDGGERRTLGSSGCCVGKAERRRRATHTRFFGVLRGEGRTMAESDAHSVIQGAASGRTMEESDAHAVLRGSAWGRQNDGGERRTRVRGARAYCRLQHFLRSSERSSTGSFRNVPFRLIAVPFLATCVYVRFVRVSVSVCLCVCVCVCVCAHLCVCVCVFYFRYHVLRGQSTMV